MTAEPLAETSSRRPVPPRDGYSVDDLFTLPDLPPHTPHFWLVELSDACERPLVRTYELDPVTKSYAFTGSHRDLL
ncbi:hypothetical protein ACIA8I_20700 [Streptomyces rishiriensis]|uniref:hypothetical protein n=1 Tax=Streptomyces rishiriensis TaxID=68264 RepID=UPI00379FDDBD